MVGEIKGGAVCNLRWDEQLTAQSQWAADRGWTHVLFVVHPDEIPANRALADAIARNNTVVLSLADTIRLRTFDASKLRGP